MVFYGELSAQTGVPCGSVRSTGRREKATAMGMDSALSMNVDSATRAANRDAADSVIRYVLPILFSFDCHLQSAACAPPA